MSAPGWKPPTIAEAKSRGCASAQGRFLRINDVIVTTGLSRATIYRLIAADAFPASVRLTAGTVGWWEAAIADWLTDRLQAA